MPGNSFSRQRRTYCCTCSSSHTSAALYSFAFTLRSINRASTAWLSNCGFAGRTAARADVKTDGCPFETKPVPELVDEKSLVRKMELRGDVGEEHEGWRCDAGLSHIENADVRSSRARWRVRGADVSHELVEFGCSDALAARRGDAVDGFEQLGGALPGQRGDVEDRRVIEKLELPAQRF